MSFAALQAIPGKWSRLFLLAHLGLGPVTGILSGGALVGAAVFWEPTFYWHLLFWVALSIGMASGFVPSSLAAIAVGIRFGFAGLPLYLCLMSVAAIGSWFVLRKVGVLKLRQALGHHPKFGQILSFIATAPWLVLFAVRMAPFAVFTWTNTLGVVSGLRPMGYITATILGAIPRASALVWAGHGARSLQEALDKGQSPQGILIATISGIVALLVLSSLAARFLLNRSQKNRATISNP